MMKNFNTYYKINSFLLISITVAGIFCSLILVFNFIFDLFKIWNWSLQFFLIIYAIGIYKIKNFIVNLFFLIIIPILIFMFENDPYIINPLQTFYEYFLVFYIFAFLYFSNCFSFLFRNSKKFFLIDLIIFIISYFILITIKFLLHSIASLTWFNVSFNGAIIYNLSWYFTNLLTVPIAISISPFSFMLFKKTNINNLNRY